MPETSLLAIGIKGERRAILEHRKYYSGYLKGLYGASKVRAELMKLTEFVNVEETLLQYLGQLQTQAVEIPQINY